MLQAWQDCVINGKVDSAMPRQSSAVQPKRGAMLQAWQDFAINGKVDSATP